MTKPSKDILGLEETRSRQRVIGQKLRELFDEVVNEPVPDAFLDILRDAESVGPGHGAE
jgi:hypothetical protein